MNFTEFDDTFFGPELVNGIAIVETESITMNPFNTTLPDHYHKPHGKPFSNVQNNFFINFSVLDQTKNNGDNSHSDSSKSSVVEASQNEPPGSGSFKLTNNGTNEVFKPSTYPPQKEEGNKL